MSVLLNGRPWLGTVQVEAPLSEIQRWAEKGIELGVPGLEIHDDTVFLDVADGVTNFVPTAEFAEVS